MEQKILTDIEKGITIYGELNDVDVSEIVRKMDADDYYSFEGTFEKLRLTNALQEILGFYKSSDIESCYFAMHDALTDSVCSLNFQKHDVSEWKRIASNICDISDIDERFNEFYENEYKPLILKELSGFPLEKTILDPRTISSIKKSIGGKNLSLYCYKKPLSNKIPSKLIIKDAIVATNSLTELLTVSSEEDAISVRIGLFIESAIDLSYFIITISFGGGVYVLTDKIHYKNPEQMGKLAYRNGGRRASEEREKELEFPYILIDKVIEERKNNTSVAKNAGNELYTFPVEEYFDSCLYYMLRFSIDKIEEENISLLYNTNQLAIGTGEVDLNDTSCFEFQSDELDTLTNELYGSIKTTLPAIMLSEFAEQLPALITQDEYNRDVKYLAHKKVVDSIHDYKYGSVDHSKYSTEGLFKLMRKSKKDLNAIIKRKIKDLYPILFASETVGFLDVDHKIYSTFDRKGNNGVGGTIRTSTVYEWNSINENTCVENGNTASIYKRIEFKRYTEIMAFLGLTREELPEMFRYYLSRTYIPYIGNTILDNINPEYEELKNDYMSSENPNGVIVIIPFSKRAFNALKKKYDRGEDKVTLKIKDGKFLV